MDQIEKDLRKAVVDSREPQEPLNDIPNGVPGQQIGLYSDNQEKDVC